MNLKKMMLELFVFIKNVVKHVKDILFRNYLHEYLSSHLL